LCLTQCACQACLESWGKSGQVEVRSTIHVKSSRPARPCQGSPVVKRSRQRDSFLLSHAVRRSVSFSVHWGLLDQRPLCGEDRGQDQTRVASGGLPKHTAGLSFTLHRGVGRSPSWRGSDIFRTPLFLFAVKLAPLTASRNADWAHPLSSPRPKPSPMVGHLVSAVHATQGAHSTSRHAADPSTVTTISFLNSHL
jgi:hypothetical protein